MILCFLYAGQSQVGLSRLNKEMMLVCLTYLDSGVNCICLVTELFLKSFDSDRFTDVQSRDGSIISVSSIMLVIPI